jgi:hypothetical protein
VCRRDHRIKDEGGWQLHQPVPGVSVWTSPLGHSITGRIPPVIPTVVAQIDRDDGIPAEAGIGNRADPCACVLQPCRHDQQDPDDRPPTSDRGNVDRRRHGWLVGGGKPYTEALLRERRAREAIYDDDEPPF